MHTDTFDSCNLELLRAKCLHSITRNVVHYLFIQKHECMNIAKEGQNSKVLDGKDQG